MILADTSALIEFDRASGSPADLRVAELIAEEGPLAVTEPVMTEVLAGARGDGEEGRLRALMQSFALLRFDPVVDFDCAAVIYRRCRAAGVTPRGLLDCAIAAVAWRSGAILLAHDADIRRVASVIGLALDDASLCG